MGIKHTCRIIADNTVQTLLANSDRLPTYYDGTILWPHRSNWTTTFVTYEPHLAREMRRFLRSGSTFWDVGANTGWFSLFASALVGPAGKIHAFEPAPDVFRALSLNVAYRANIHAHNIGIGDSDGMAEFSAQGMASTASFVDAVTRLNAIYLPDAAVSRVQVQMRRLDTFLEQGAPPTLVKIDIEGFELHALKGASALLASKPPILIEVHPIVLAMSGGSEAEMWDLLKQYGYRWTTIHKDTNSIYTVLAT